MTSEESFHFQRGLYNLWLYSDGAEYVVAMYDDDDGYDDEELDYDPLPLPEDFNEDHVAKLSTDELCEMGRVYLFLMDLLARAYRRQGREIDGSVEGEQASAFCRSVS